MFDSDLYSDPAGQYRSKYVEGEKVEKSVGEIGEECPAKEGTGGREEAKVEF